MIMFNVCVFMPCAFIWVLQQPSHYYFIPEFKKKWGLFYEGLKVQKNKFAMMFNLMYMLRRAVILALAFYIQEYSQF